ncbi:MAG: FkbM family methyltransferase [Pseudomonadota bacterium]
MKFLSKLFKNIRETVDAFSPEVITREHVIWAYRLFFDRNPESETAITEKLNAWRTTGELRTEFLVSSEFHAKNPGLAITNESVIVIKELQNRRRLFVDLSDRVIGHGIIKGQYESEEVDFLKSVVKPGDTVLDIGANIGFFTIVMADLIGETGKSYSFEPLQRNFKLLKRSIEENKFDDRATIEHAAVGETQGTLKLISPTETLNLGGAFLKTGDTKVPPGHIAEDVTVIRLDNYLIQHPVKFIKIDIEGAELLALRGAMSILTEDKPIIMAELNPPQLKKVSKCTSAEFISEMNKYGYNCYKLNSGKVGQKITSLSSDEILSVVFVSA